MSKANPQQVQSELCIQFEHASGQCSELTLVKTPLPASFSSSYRELFLYLETHDLLGGFKVNCLSHVHCSVLQQVLQYFIYILSMIFFFRKMLSFPLNPSKVYFISILFSKKFSVICRMIQMFQDLSKHHFPTDLSSNMRVLLMEMTWLCVLPISYS